MKKFFEYNWQVRDEWFEWCKNLSEEELLKERIGGLGNILYTLFHIIDVEYSWIRGIQGKEDLVLEFKNYQSIDRLKSLSDSLREEIKEFLVKDFNRLDEHVTVPWDDEQFSKEEIIHHVIAHEIHHIGQLSVWAREAGLQPVSANYIRRGLK